MIKYLNSQVDVDLAEFGKQRNTDFDFFPHSQINLLRRDKTMNCSMFVDDTLD